MERNSLLSSRYGTIKRVIYLVKNTHGRKLKQPDDVGYMRVASIFRNECAR